jgi:putative phosphoserine phosphatase/1-acylglycerol-3-phosphate O-acyltransferase
MSAETMRLPGSVAEVDASKAGPLVGAFFDLDGTLISGYSASHLAQQRLRDREIGLSEVVRTLGVAVGAGLGRGAGFADLMKLGAEAWRGRAHEDLEEMGERLFQQKIKPLIYPEMRELVIAHHRRGHTVVLSSSATSYQVEPVARFLGVDHVLCNRFEIQDGVLTGNVVTPILWGPGKAASVQGFASKHGIDLADSYFYADGNEDLALMHLVGHPRPTNPGSQLEKVAAARGWPVLRFRIQGSETSGDRLRATAARATSVPLGIVGAAVGAATRNRRKSPNLGPRRWIDELFRTNGVEVETAGRENLRASRPAVFVVNRRNNVDLLVAALLVDRKFAVVMPDELEGDPVLGNFANLADVTSSLENAGEAVRNGLSIIVAPEATRHGTTGVGKFEDGAFRLAMEAGVPIVPIVIHDSEMIASGDASSMNPGTVHVTVLPPVPTDTWTPGRIGKRVTDVRQQFLATLRDGFHPAPTPAVDAEKPSRSPDRATMIRNLIGTATVFPAATEGIAVGLLNRNRRKGVDQFMRRLADSLFLATGVSINAEGKSNLEAERPAVFIFNHKNNFDIFVAGRLVGHDFTSVGKKEAGENPIGAAMGKLIDAVFIDRDDAAGAVAALQPVTEAVARGMSLVISPEGTRSKTGELMPFKKGPFRIAMAAGVPIVPIVIRNAEDLAPHNSMVMHSAKIDVKILPPITTSDWTVKNLDQKIDAVRQQYLDTLANW